MLRDPLVHMVRNSIDHGIETPAARRAAGKPETGRLTVSARQSGNQIVVEITDDGTGIDVARVAAKAVAAGLHSEAELAAMNEAQRLDLIFAAGVSSRDTVTAISGRGVGMDVVRANIEQIGRPRRPDQPTGSRALHQRPGTAHPLDHFDHRRRRRGPALCAAAPGDRGDRAAGRRGGADRPDRRHRDGDGVRRAARSDRTGRHPGDRGGPGDNAGDRGDSRRPLRAGYRRGARCRGTCRQAGGARGDGRRALCRSDAARQRAADAAARRRRRRRCRRVDLHRHRGRRSGGCRRRPTGVGCAAVRRPRRTPPRSGRSPPSTVSKRSPLAPCTTPPAG